MDHWKAPPTPPPPPVLMEACKFSFIILSDLWLSKKKTTCVFVNILEKVKGGSHYFKYWIIQDNDLTFRNLSIGVKNWDQWNHRYSPSYSVRH